MTETESQLPQHYLSPLPNKIIQSLQQWCLKFEQPLANLLNHILQP